MATTREARVKLGVDTSRAKASWRGVPVEALEAFRDLIDGWLHWKSAEYKAPLLVLHASVTS